MKQQLQKRGLISLPPIHTLIQRYNSLPKLNRNTPDSKFQPEAFERQASYDSLPSSFVSVSSERRKTYISKSLSFFKKQSQSLSLQPILAVKSDEKRSGKEVRRLVDKQFVLDEAKKAMELKVNVRLQQKSQNVLRISKYDQFSPFKRNHAINRRIVRVEDPNPEPLRMGDNNSRK